MRQALAFVVAVVVGTGFGATGCAAPPAPRAAATQTRAHPHAHDPRDHNHDRGNMMIASDGWVDALLTAHLSSKEGNELDVFVEQSGSPLALKTTRLEATAFVGDDKKTLEFACAPRDERPADEADGTCSHFVARAGWMQPDDNLKVEAALPLKGGEAPYVWRAFNPTKYAHHIE